MSVFLWWDAQGCEGALFVLYKRFVCVRQQAGNWSLEKSPEKHQLFNKVFIAEFT
jgi:hypothetical protein